MATFVFFDEFGYDLGMGKHNLQSDTLKIALVSSSAGTGVDQSADAVLGDITQITGGSGYTTGGVTITTDPVWEETSAGSGTWRLVTPDLTLTATSGGMGPFRYVVLFNDTQTSPSKPLIGYLDYQSDITVSSGNTFLIDVGTNGWFQIPIT